MTLTENGRSVALDPFRIRCQKGFFWGTVTAANSTGSERTVRGIPNRKLGALQDAAMYAAVRTLYAHPEILYPALPGWAETARRSLEEKKKRGWIWLEDPKGGTFTPYKAQSTVWANDAVFRKYADNILALELQKSGLPGAAHLAEFTASENAALVQALLKEDKEFFDTAEKNPLTEEQRLAAATFAPRVLVVAAAGSGKTSVLTVKGAYALKKGFFAPNEILLLAFNTKAAEELKERLTGVCRKNRCAGAAGVTCSTFHAFCLSVIGEATGRKPRVASFLEQNKAIEVLSGILKEKLKSPVYKGRFRLFMAVYGISGPSCGAASGSHEESFETRAGLFVKSRAEQNLADWLTFCGIDFRYEERYPFPTADKAHSQYLPDFCFPEKNVWLELWAIGDDEPEPAKFRGYQEQKAWKRNVHREHGTTLLEVTAREVHDGSAFKKLAAAFKTLGIRGRRKEEPEAEQSEYHGAFLSVLRTFQVQAYSNDYSVAKLRARIAENSDKFGYRESLFLDLYEPLEKEWRRLLDANNETDFERMMLDAARIIESGRWKSPYRLVMVDEFQDTSRVRARVLKGLLKTPGTRLFAVGDDWQSINRFAGADTSVMTRFSENFASPGEFFRLSEEAPHTLLLSHTFRCNQSLCNVSSRFVTQNPEQIKKSVKSFTPKSTPSVRVLELSSEVDIFDAVKQELAVLESLGPGENGERRTVAVLGRYRQDEQYRPSGAAYPSLSITFSTIHRAKGLEYDHVIIPRVYDGKYYNFPCRIADDPLLDLAMPSPEEFPFAEERRLFYVALTRARHSASVIAVGDAAFARELLSPFKGCSVLKVAFIKPKEEEASPQPQRRSAKKSRSTALRCPECGSFLVVRRNRRDNSEFLGCQGYPRCRYTQDLPSETPAEADELNEDDIPF
jgi:DNA helicase-4